MNLLYLIVARGGSKGVPGKNLRKIGGLSLVAYKAISARKSKHCSRLIISTDSPEIQAEARIWGVEVPFTRPAELATDGAQTDGVVEHAMEFVEAEGHGQYDALMLLEPSSPFATHHHYDAAVEMMEGKQANVVVGMRHVVVNSIFQGPMDNEGRITSIIDKIFGLRRLARQDVPQEYTMNGAFYLLRWDFFLKHRQRYCDRDHSYGLVMPEDYSIEIDTQQDLQRAEWMVEKGIVDLSFWKD